MNPADQQRLQWELANVRRQAEGHPPLPPPWQAQQAVAPQPPAVIDRFDRQTKDIGLGAAVGVAAALLIARLRRRGGWA